MKRTVLTLAAALSLLAIAPAAALARHHHPNRHAHARRFHVERFGAADSGTSSSDTAGKVDSFSNGTLTILLADGSSVSGRVTGATEIECTTSPSSQSAHEDRDRGDSDQAESSRESNQAENDGDRNEAETGGDSNQTGSGESDAAEDKNAGNCSSANLTHGAVVREAVLGVSGQGSAWRKVELES